MYKRQEYIDILYEKQLTIRTQINKLLDLGVIEELRASVWSQAHPVPITNILETITRLDTLTRVAM